VGSAGEEEEHGGLWYARALLVCVGVGVWLCGRATVARGCSCSSSCCGGGASYPLRSGARYAMRCDARARRKGPVYYNLGGRTAAGFDCMVVFGELVVSRRDGNWEVWVRADALVTYTVPGWWSLPRICIGAELGASSRGPGLSHTWALGEGLRGAACLTLENKYWGMHC
jgi:hypothetical protein